MTMQLCSWNRTARVQPIFLRDRVYILHPQDGKLLVGLVCKKTQQLKPLNVAAPYQKGPTTLMTPRLAISPYINS